MIRSLHRRFLWYAYLWACVFVLIVMLVTLGSLVHYIGGIIADTLTNTLRLAESDPDSTVTSRSRLPSYLVEVQQASVDLHATKLADGDALVFLRGERNDWSEEEIRDTAKEMLESTRKIGILRHDSLCYTVDRSGPVIRIAAVEYDGYRAFLLRIVQWGMLLYTVLCGALFLLLKLAEIRLLRPAERAWELQERFVGDASHEMKTPLAIILSNAELGVSEQPQETEHRFSVIVSEAQRMKLLITQMLETARLESAAAKRRGWTVFSLSDAVTESALLFEEPLYEKRISLTYDVDDGLNVLGDEAVLKQIMNILLENAKKYTPNGNKVTVSAKRIFSHVIVTVRNEGIGLDRVEQESIFERFYRADTARTHTEGSYGLGLSIAKSLVTSMNGHIRCSSDGSTYTAFIVDFRLHRKQA